MKCILIARYILGHPLSCKKSTKDMVVSLHESRCFKAIAMYLGDDVVILNIDGCASIIGFREFKNWNLRSLSTF